MVITDPLGYHLEISGLVSNLRGPYFEKNLSQSQEILLPRFLFSLNSKIILLFGLSVDTRVFKKKSDRN